MATEPEELSQNLLFALDYDGTYTRDPDFWLEFIKLAESHGHRVCVATMRTQDEKEDMCDRLFEACPQIIPTHRNAKQQFLASYGVRPDIWIDDQPHFIVRDAQGADKGEMGPHKVV